MAKLAFLNNHFVAEENAALHFRDLSFQRGYGVFDFFRLVGNSPLFLPDHLDRFYFSAESMHLAVPLGRSALESVILELIEQNNLPNTGLRLSLTGGYSEDGFNLGKPNFLLSQHPFTATTEEQRTKGIKLLTYPYQRQLPQVKSIDYLMAIWLQPKKLAVGADDILYHQHGLISECPRSNFFLLTANNTLVTPAGNALAGVTRKKLLQVAREYFAVEEREVLFEEIQTAKEAFITSTTKQVLPVAQIDDTIFPERKTALQLLHLFQSAFFA
jgi:branched-subunit amino acid aminotransferase/4-amino-4-deoxychorismate lyase